MKPIEQRVFEAHVEVLRRSGWSAVEWGSLTEETQESWGAIVTVVRNERGDRAAKIAAAFQCAYDLDMTTARSWEDLSKYRQAAWGAAVDVVISAPPLCKKCGQETVFGQHDPYEQQLCYECAMRAPHATAWCEKCDTKSHRAANHGGGLCYGCAGGVS